MSERKITENQMTVLRFVSWMRLGTSKREIASTNWRALDSLERRGLIERRGNGRYFITERGTFLISDGPSQEG